MTPSKPAAGRGHALALFHRPIHSAAHRGLRGAGRALAYRRAKSVADKQPFGTVLDVNAPGYGWFSYSIRATEIEKPDFRITIDGPDCTQPYAASVVKSPA
jgi:hypothetical protein